MKCLSVMVYLLAVTRVALAGCISPIQSESSQQSGTATSAEPLEGFPLEPVSGTEIEGLFMREEEKLARDLCSVLYEQWGQRIFSNMARSEQTHTNTIKILLATYDIDDPVTTDEPGVFENEELFALYESLLTVGKTSVVDALKVGALVEKVDIQDIA